MWGHVDDRLAPFCEGALPEREARAVAAHLAGCRLCERRRREVERGLALVRELRRERLPGARAEAIRARLAGAPDLEAMPFARPRARVLLAAAVLAAAAGASLLVFMRSAALRLETGGGPLSEFERVGVALQRQAEAGMLPLDVSSGSPEVVRRWVEESTALSTNLALGRPVEDAGRFELLGASKVGVGGATAVAVAYRIDGAAALLLTADAAAVGDRPPAWMLAGKTVRHAVDTASGAKVLTWTNSGQVYTLVSELPGPGLESCYICHTDPARRRVIRRIGAQGL